MTAATTSPHRMARGVSSRAPAGLTPSTAPMRASCSAIRAGVYQEVLGTWCFDLGPSLVLWSVLSPRSFVPRCARAHQGLQDQDGAGLGPRTDQESGTKHQGPRRPR